MKLISCEYCGVVIDVDRCDVMEKENWGPFGTYTYIECPVCKRSIYDANGNEIGNYL